MGNIYLSHYVEGDYKGGGYASPYYDPIKAHEYYEAHKQLKGRASTAGLNDEGKEAASYVKEQLNVEKKKLIDDLRNKTNASKTANREQASKKIENTKEVLKEELSYRKNRSTASIKQSTDQMQNEIDSIREHLKKLSKNSPERERLLKDIAGLRQKNAENRAKINERYSKFASSARTKASGINAEIRADLKSKNDKLSEIMKSETTRIGEEYSNKYIEELEKIRSDDRFLKKSNKKSSNKKSSNSSSGPLVTPKLNKETKDTRVVTNPYNPATDKTGERFAKAYLNKLDLGKTKTKK